MRNALHYDVRCFDLPGSLAADCQVDPVAPDPTGTVVWRYRVSCRGEKTFNALMQQLELQRIAYDVKIINAPAQGQKPAVARSTSLKPLFLGLILVAIVAFSAIWAVNSPDGQQWAAQLQRSMNHATGSLVKHPTPED